MASIGAGVHGSCRQSRTAHTCLCHGSTSHMVLFGVNLLFLASSTEQHVINSLSDPGMLAMICMYSCLLIILVTLRYPAHVELGA